MKCPAPAPRDMTLRIAPTGDETASPSTPQLLSSNPSRGRTCAAFAEFSDCPVTGEMPPPPPQPCKSVMVKATKGRTKHRDPTIGKTNERIGFSPPKPKNHARTKVACIRLRSANESTLQIKVFSSFYITYDESMLFTGHTNQGLSGCTRRQWGAMIGI